MPSVSKKQAKLMSAIDHGWKPKKPRHKLPSRSVAREFHEADKAEGKYMHAAGGFISPLSAAIEHGFGPGFSQHMPNAGGPSMPGMAHMRMPRIPIADTLHRIDQNVKMASLKLPKIKQQTNAFRARLPKGAKFARGGR